MCVVIHSEYFDGFADKDSNILGGDCIVMPF